MKRSINHINEQLQHGIVPDELNYQVEPSHKIDTTKLDYVFKAVEKIANRFPNGWQTIPGFEELFERIAITLPTPEEELKEKRNLNNINNNE